MQSQEKVGTPVLFCLSFFCLQALRKFERFMYMSQHLLCCPIFKPVNRKEKISSITSFVFSFKM